MSPAGAMPGRGRGDIDEISRTLGALEAGVEQARRERSALAEDLRDVKGGMAELKEQLGALGDDIRQGFGQVAGHETRLQAVEATAEDFKTIKQRVIGMRVLWGALVAAGAVLAANYKALAAWWKGI